MTKQGKDGLMGESPRLRPVGGDDDAEAAPLHPEVAELVRWFTGWWLSRGLELVPQEEAEERSAA